MIAATPSADKREVDVFAATIPAAPDSPARGPRAIVVETTNSTAGPGVMHSTVSSTQNAIQVSQRHRASPLPTFARSELRLGELFEPVHRLQRLPLE